MDKLVIDHSRNITSDLVDSGDFETDVLIFIPIMNHRSTTLLWMVFVVNTELDMELLAVDPPSLIAAWQTLLRSPPSASESLYVKSIYQSTNVPTDIVGLNDEYLASFSTIMNLMNYRND